MEKLENKYIELLLKGCIGVQNIDSLLIVLDLNEHIPFAQKIKDKAHSLGVKDVAIQVFDVYELYNMYKENNIDDISLDNAKIRHLIDKSKWDEYAKKHGGILFIDSQVPDLMNSIEKEKIQKRVMEGTKTNKYYRSNVTSGKFNWTIAAMPNQKWAETVFPNDKQAYEKLYLKILEACMVDKEDPIIAWGQYSRRTNMICDVLNSLDIKRLHYQNKLGTDLYLSMPNNHIWLNTYRYYKGVSTMENIPSYEIFSSPDYRMTNGIVFASKPLVYEGSLIDNFYLIFKNGKVIDFDAQKGREVLEGILNLSSFSKPNENNNCDYLGEVAFVEYNSPISDTGIIYYNTLFDENASCHLALGDSFPDAIVGGIEMTEEQLIEQGLNQAVTHVDFMVGTDDLLIVAETNKGDIPIIESGNFSKTLLKMK